MKVVLCNNKLRVYGLENAGSSGVLFSSLESHEFVLLAKLEMGAANAACASHGYFKSQCVSQPTGGGSLRARAR
jgi:hypothetical protein